MVCVGIDVAKDKHDCFILSSEGEALKDFFTVANNLDGFKNAYNFSACLCTLLPYASLYSYCITVIHVFYLLIFLSTVTPKAFLFFRHSISNN